MVSEEPRILITGGLGLLGRAVIAQVEKSGGWPIASSRSRSAVAEFNVRSAEGGRRARAVHLEFASEKELRNSLVKIAHEYGGSISGLVNNAYANFPFKGVEHVGWDDWLEAFRVNVAAATTVATTLAGVGGLRSVVNVASIYGIRAPEFPMYPQGHDPSSLVYGVTKAALLSLTQYLAAYWGEAGIRVNAVSPGGIFNQQGDNFYQKYCATVPAKRMVTPEEVAGGIGYLLSAEASGITGQNLIIDAGKTIW